MPFTTLNQDDAQALLDTLEVLPEHWSIEVTSNLRSPMFIHYPTDTDPDRKLCNNIYHALNWLKKHYPITKEQDDE